jgi:hypothetical protein
VLLDMQYTATPLNTRDSKLDVTPSLATPLNWRAPVDYIGSRGEGMVSIQLDVIDKPSRVPTLFNVCLENSTGFACMPYPNAYTAPASLSFAAPFSTFYNFAQVDWNKGIGKISLVLKDEAQNIPATKDTQTTALFYPTTLHVVLTVLPPNPD